MLIPPTSVAARLDRQGTACLAIGRESVPVRRDAATVGVRKTTRGQVRDALIKRRRPDLPRVQRPFTGVLKGTGVLRFSGGSGPRQLRLTDFAREIASRR